MVIIITIIITTIIIIILIITIIIIIVIVIIITTIASSGPSYRYGLLQVWRTERRGRRLTLSDGTSLPAPVIDLDDPDRPINPDNDRPRNPPRFLHTLSDGSQAWRHHPWMTGTGRGGLIRPDGTVFAVPCPRDQSVRRLEVGGGGGSAGYCIVLSYRTILYAAPSHLVCYWR
jgi:hypothetical protein